jgi:hypothetical protein
MKTLRWVRRNFRPVIPALILLFVCDSIYSQAYFRSGIFLHHSTGQNIWGPNGSSTSVPQEMEGYNTAHSFTGPQAVTLNEEWWAPDNNEWATQHAFFENPDQVTGIGYYLQGNRIIVIKSCFPSSSIIGAGNPEDTLTPDLKTVANYKWHWRHIARVMKMHPQNFFVIWTNAPLEPNSTNPDEAAFSDWFCSWAKDTLARGLDPAFGHFPGNVYVFDFFHKITGSNGMMLSKYATGPGDSHPNAAATTLIAPQFVQEIFNASIGYESVFGIQPSPESSLYGISAAPNPFREQTVIGFSLQQDQPAELALFDMTGRKIRSVWNGNRKGNYRVFLRGDQLAPGMFCIRFSVNGGLQSSLVLIIE